MTISWDDKLVDSAGAKKASVIIEWREQGYGGLPG
jgi:hypothetical protein